MPNTGLLQGLFPVAPPSSPIPIGQAFQLCYPANGSGAFTLNAEYCFGYLLPGSGSLSQITLDHQTAGDTGSVYRLGFRANNAGLPGPVVQEMTIVATGGASNLTVAGLSLPFGGAGSEVIWVSLAWQGGTTTSPKLETGNSHPFLFGGMPNTNANGFNANCYTRSSVSGTFASSPAPTISGAWSGSGAPFPHIFLTRGS